MLPGPGAYAENSLRFPGSLSQYRRSSPNPFPKEKRHNPFNPLNTDIPGPGNYKSPSEFGEYVSKHSIELS
jgi:hypothetical protein